MPTPTPPYQFIAIARTIARGFSEQAIGHPEGEALNENRHERPGAARAVRSVRRTLSAAPVPAR
jgi:hypothetical protein